MTTLADIGAAPLAEVAGGLPDAARGIPLRARGGWVRAFAVVDAEDYERVSAHRWYRKPDGYVVRNVAKEDGGQQTLSLHRFVLGLGPGDPEHVDHCNHDLLDNRRENLRRCTHQQNHENRRPNRGSTSRFRGVSWAKDRGKWKAYAKRDGIVHNLGYFDVEQEAADAAAAFRRQRMPFATE